MQVREVQMVTLVQVNKATWAQVQEEHQEESRGKRGPGPGHTLPWPAPACSSYLLASCPYDLYSQNKAKLKVTPDTAPLITSQEEEFLPVTLS